MTRYEDVKKNGKLLTALTSLTVAEFEELLAVFERIWDEWVAANQIEGRDRERGFGGGRKPVLEKDEDKLLFILCYFKTCPLQIVLGHMSGMSQSQANEWIHRLDGILRTALGKMGHLPERDPEKLAETLEEGGEKDVIIDGAERRILPSPPDMYSMTYPEYLLRQPAVFVDSGEPDYPFVGWITGVTPTGLIMWFPFALLLNSATDYVIPYNPPFSPPYDGACP